MSLKSFLKKIVGVFKKSNVGAAAIAIVETGAQKLVAFLKTTTVGTAVIAAVHDAASSDLAGAAKFEKVVADVLPIALAFLTNNAAFVLEGKAIEAVVRELVQSIYNDEIGLAKDAIAKQLAALGVD